MTSEIDKVKDKLKKLFALSKSPNAAEAASALRKAQELMDQYNVSAEEIGRPEIRAEDINTNTGEKAPQHQGRLMFNIARAFGCRSAYGFIRLEGYRAVYGSTFIGLDHQVKIASFIATVLLRKMAKARTEYIKSLKKVKSRYQKTIRADQFCRGWVASVCQKLREFANTPEVETALDAYEQDQGWVVGSGGIDRKAKRDYGDWYNGLAAGRGVLIQHGVEGQESGARLLGMRK
jgi:hypothetical protein